MPHENCFTLITLILAIQYYSDIESYKFFHSLLGFKKVTTFNLSKL